MKKKENQDWRLVSYNGHLNGETFRLKHFISNDKNDHEHCEFCWKKITDLQIENEDCVSEGYFCFNSKTKQTNWICKNCFNDFKEKLRSGKYDKEFREFLASPYGASQFNISTSYFSGNLSDYILQYYHFIGAPIPKEYEEYYKDAKERYNNERKKVYEKRRLYE